MRKYTLELNENELESFYFAIGTAMRLVAQRKEDGISLEDDSTHNAAFLRIWNAQLKSA